MGGLPDVSGCEVLGPSEGGCFNCVEVPRRVLPILSALVVKSVRDERTDGWTENSTKR